MDAAEQTARFDVKRWAVGVRESISEFSQLARPQILPVEPLSEAEETTIILARIAADRIWNSAAQWYKAIEGQGLPANVKQVIKDNLDLEVQEIVSNMRNITEHWEDNRRRYEQQDFRGSRSAIRWYRDREQEQELVNGPWSWTWGIDRGFELGQVLELDRLLKEVLNVEATLATITPGE